MELVIGAAAVFTVSGADDDAADAGGLDSLEIDLSLMFGDVDHLSVEIGRIGILAAHLSNQLSVGIQPVGFVTDFLDAGKKRAVMAFFIAACVVFASRDGEPSGDHVAPAVEIITSALDFPESC